MTERLYVYVTGTNKMTLLLVPPPGRVCIFSVSFLQNVQDPNKLYFLNLPSFCFVSFIKPVGGGRQLGGADVVGQM